MKQHPESAPIVIVGAGVSGIATAIRLRELGIEDFVILERASGPGGTWHNYRYPGLSCDIPSHLYCFSFEQKSDWTRTHAGQEEIREYLAHCVDKYGIGPHIRYDVEVVGARWDDAARQWCLDLADGQRLHAGVFVSAIGMFNEIQRPDIEGLDDFGGQTLHSARWPDHVDLRGKRVAVIGTAASAVQMIPELAKQAARLLVYQRTANWVFPKEDRMFSTGELERFRQDPQAGLKLRQELHDFFELFLPFDNADLMQMVADKARANLDNVVDPVLRAKMLPNVPVCSQRPLFSDDYYPTFNRPNVELVTAGIERITAAGIRTDDGMERPIDVLVLATGYAANKFLSVIEVCGRDGLRLADAWREGAQAYLGMTTSGFPNLFMLYGPNTNNGSIIYMLEQQAAYIANKIAWMREHDIEWIDVRREAMDRYNEELQRDLDAVEVWRTPATRYYRAASGRIVTQWPHNMGAYQARTRKPDLEAFEIAPANAVA
ncbi:flavin-containing monooxygenase [Panacagrimonas sp.]|uniref:flavin-containing monooxygenase n=1 Tax=Panacagrimonas sp. TaxID=2480088 RepID=UPI003B519164